MSYLPLKKPLLIESQLAITSGCLQFETNSNQLFTFPVYLHSHFIAISQSTSHLSSPPHQFKKTAFQWRIPNAKMSSVNSSTVNVPTFQISLELNQPSFNLF
jgi:hypothetical protein